MMVLITDNFFYSFLNIQRIVHAVSVRGIASNTHGRRSLCGIRLASDPEK
ncbi:MAG TPA: hypothetical protein IGS40_26365 [Trichormus sp. M33_DOE_039]|nr:hypothetical protein [Trichormus sp. M33_DOE_039]